MANRPSIRVVSPDEKPSKPKVLTLAQAVEMGEYIDILLAQRREIVTCLPEEKGPAKAALHRQLSIISKEIESLRAADRDAAIMGDDSDLDDSFDASAI